GRNRWEVHQTPVITTKKGKITAPVDAGVTLVCVSPNGTLLAGDSMGTVVRLWDIHNGLLLEKLKGHLDSVYQLHSHLTGNSLSPVVSMDYGTFQLFMIMMVILPLIRPVVPLLKAKIFDLFFSNP
ncbi:hypothetical protein KEM48_012264, partial [Puccinia striiformis f. sp. tritici PST-130]